MNTMLGGPQSGSGRYAKIKAIHITGHGSLQVSDVDVEDPTLSRLDNRIIDGGEVISPTHRPSSTAQEHYFPASGTHFC
jgi:hypothetical protein